MSLLQSLRTPTAIAALATSCMPFADPAGAVPPPPEQLHAICVNSTYASDIFLCARPDLKALDDALGSLLARAGELATSPQTTLVEPQSAWFRRRSLCAMKSDQQSCLRAAYGERIAVLRGLLGETGMVGPTFQCAAKGQLNDARVVLSEDNSAAIIKDAKVIAVGILLDDSKAWVPYVAVRRKGKSLTINASDSSQAKCRPSDR